MKIDSNDAVIVSPLRSNPHIWSNILFHDNFYTRLNHQLCSQAYVSNFQDTINFLCWQGKIVWFYKIYLVYEWYISGVELGDAGSFYYFWLKIFIIISSHKELKFKNKEYVKTHKVTKHVHCLSIETIYGIIKPYQSLWTECNF